MRPKLKLLMYLLFARYYDIADMPANDMHPSNHDAAGTLESGLT